MVCSNIGAIKRHEKAKGNIMSIFLTEDHYFVCETCNYVVLTGDETSTDNDTTKIWEFVDEAQKNGGQLIEGNDKCADRETDYSCEICGCHYFGVRHLLVILTRFDAPPTNESIVAEDAPLERLYTQLLLTLHSIDPKNLIFCDYATPDQIDWNAPHIETLRNADLYDIICDLEKCAPHGYEFAVKNGFYGYWEVSK